MEIAAQSLVGNVGQLLGEEYRLLRDVGSEVTELRDDDLATMNALLRMQSEADEGAVDHFVREWMKQLRELAYDAEDCVDHYRLRVKSRPRDGWRRSCCAAASPAKSVPSVPALSPSANGTRGTASIARRCAGPLLLFLPAPAGPSTMLAPVLSELVSRRANDNPEQHLVGIDGQANDIMAELVKPSSSTTQSFKVFSIVGKTTLAMEVCRRLEPEFPYQAMVSVSQAFDPSRDLKALLKRMLEQIFKPKTNDGKGVKEVRDLEGIGNLNADDMAKKLEESLKNKSSLNVKKLHITRGIGVGPTQIYSTLFVLHKYM